MGHDPGHLLARFCGRFRTVSVQSFFVVMSRCRR